MPSEAFTLATSTGRGVKFVLDTKETNLPQVTDELLAYVREVLEKVDATSGQVTFKNTVQPLLELENVEALLDSSITFTQHVHPDKELRGVSADCSKTIADAQVEFSMRVSTYRVVKEALAKVNKKELSLTGDEKTDNEIRRWLKKTVEDYERNGLALPEKSREELKLLKQEEQRLGIDFQKNLADSVLSANFTREELSGVPETVIESLSTVNEQGKTLYTVHTHYPEAFPVIEHCSVRDTRMKMSILMNTKAKDQNLALLNRMVELRLQMAQMLGFPSHAHLRQQSRMAKSPDVVIPFLSDLSKRLLPIYEKELEEMRQMRIEEEGIPEADHAKISIEPCDFRYYLRKYEERKSSLDKELLRPYFDIADVTRNIMEIYQEVLSLRFERVEQAKTWHTDATAYDVFDTAGEGSKFMGRFFMDMHPRDGKYGHAAVFGLQPSCTLFSAKENGTGDYQRPSAALVTNFTKGSEGKPSYLTHGEVQTFFHEFGHLMHGICSETALSRFSGTSVERDFVEAPSQMLENWCWTKDGLNRVASPKMIPDELLDKLISSRTVGEATASTRQLTFGIYDQRLHGFRSKEEIKDANELYNEVSLEISKIRPTEVRIICSAACCLLQTLECNESDFLGCMHFLPCCLLLYFFELFK